MSISFDDNESVMPEVGKTSIDTATDKKSKKKKKKGKKEKKKGKKEKKTRVKKEKDESKGVFNVWDAILLISLICVVVACVLLVMELRSFSNFPFTYPWKTTEVNL